MSDFSLTVTVWEVHICADCFMNLRWNFIKRLLFKGWAGKDYFGLNIKHNSTVSNFTSKGCFWHFVLGCINTAGFDGQL